MSQGSCVREHSISSNLLPLGPPADSGDKGHRPPRLPRRLLSAQPIKPNPHRIETLAFVAVLTSSWVSVPPFGEECVSAAMAPLTTSLPPTPAHCRLDTYDALSSLPVLSTHSSGSPLQCPCRIPTHALNQEYPLRLHFCLISVLWDTHVSVNSNCGG